MYQDNRGIEFLVKYLRRSRAFRKAKWEKVKNDEAIKGIYNFKNEIPQIREFLDKMHHKHESENPYREPEGYYFPINLPRIPAFEVAVNNPSHIDDVVTQLYD